MSLFKHNFPNSDVIIFSNSYNATNQEVTTKLVTIHSDKETNTFYITKQINPQIHANI